MAYRPQATAPIHSVITVPIAERIPTCRKTILALATAGALAGTALPALAHDYDDDGYYRHRYRDYYHRDYRRHDYDDYSRSRYREGYRRWWRHRHHDYDYDRHYYRRYY